MSLEREEKWVLLGIAILFLVLAIIYFKPNRRYEVDLGMDGDVRFVKEGWFKNEFYPVNLIREEWHWKSPDGWKRIATPYESVFNRRGEVLVLDEYGQIYLRSKDRTERIPLKVIDGTWHRFTAEFGEWLEILFDAELD
jgi:hypothetical protein